MDPANRFKEMSSHTTDQCLSGDISFHGELIKAMGRSSSEKSSLALHEDSSGRLT